jgi:hypothetical protein
MLILLVELNMLLEQSTDLAELKDNFCDEVLEDIFTEIYKTQQEIFRMIAEAYIYKYGKKEQECHKCKTKFVPLLNGGCLTTCGWRCLKCLYSICI